MFVIYVINILECTIYLLNSDMPVVLWVFLIEEIFQLNTQLINIQYL